MISEEGRKGQAQPCGGDAARGQRGEVCVFVAGEWLDWTGSVSEAAWWRDETGQPTIGGREAEREEGADPTSKGQPSGAEGKGGEREGEEEDADTRRE
jgi:hypothetical protein